MRAFILVVNVCHDCVFLSEDLTFPSLFLAYQNSGVSPAAGSDLA
jgi:hypothetical protein